MSSIACHRTNKNGAGPWGDPCGNINSTNPNVPCCVPGDQCLSDGLCKYTHSFKLGSGYYIAGCTTRTGTGKGCPDNLCLGHDRPDVTFLSDSGLWACCSETSDGPNCTAPSDELFNAPAPSALTTLFLVPSSGFVAISTEVPSTSSTSPTVAGSAASSPVPSASSEPGNKAGGGGLSSGAGAGIGAAVGTLVFLAACLTAWYFLVRRRRGRRDAGQRSGHQAPSTHELHGFQLPPELPAGSKFVAEAMAAPVHLELPSTSASNAPLYGVETRNNGLR